MRTIREDGRQGGSEPRHGVYALLAARRAGDFDEETEAAICTRVAELATDSGGLEHVNARELSLLRDAAVIDLILQHVVSEIARRRTVFNGDALLTIVTQMSGLMKTKRGHLVALGIRPDPAERLPDVRDYIRAQEGVAS